MTKGPPDWIQQAVIARAKELGWPDALSAYAISKQTGERVSDDHISNYLNRRSSMGSHKLQHVLRVLGLGVVVKENK